jgi:4a-hydroxytetrahydrobiopterin dehydratase
MTIAMTIEDLLAQHCRPRSRADAMAEVAIDAALKVLPHWRSAAGLIERRFQFPDFHHTMAFVNALAWIAHAEDHHPDLIIGYGHCTVRWSTHSAGGVSLNDLICAARTDALLA